MQDSLKDITHVDDVRVFVYAFYAQVQQDDLIGPIFNLVIEDRWPIHLEKMVGFWQTVLLNERAYSGSPFPPHAKLPINKSHFDRWLSLFNATINDHFKGEKASEAKWRAQKMGEMFSYKIEYLRNQKDDS